ncbi:MAG: DoxX family protein [Bacteroidia bacterium]
MKNLKRIGTIIFALPFGIFGISHLMMANNMKGMIPSYIPGGIFWIYLTGIAMLAACIALIINKKVKLTGLLLAAYLLVMILTMHLPMLTNPNPQMAQMAVMETLKDLALLGASLLIAGTASEK